MILLSLVLMCASCAHPLEVRESVADCAQRDGDKDGVNDCNDKCPNSKAGETIGPDGCISYCAAGSLQAQSITFGKDAELTNEQQTYLKYELRQLLRNPALKLELVGHSDRCETPKRADEIGLARANEVKDWFIRNGLDATRIVKIRSAGSKEPVVPTSDRRPNCDVEANRRVDRNVRY